MKAQGMENQKTIAPLSPELFRTNRRRLLESMVQGEGLLHSSNARMHRNGDQYFSYRQHSGFYYLSGIRQAESLLLLSHNRQVLFLQKPSPHTELWDGAVMKQEEAAWLSGMDEIRWLEELPEVLEEVLGPVSRLYMNYSGGAEADYFPDRDLYRKLKKRWPGVERLSADPLLMRLRMVKQDLEVEAMRKSIAISAAAFRRVLSEVRPLMREFEVEARLGSVFRSMGASGHAFEPILATGANALVLHYIQNDGVCREGDLLLMDFGAELNCYAADCSRTIPVSARYSDRQRRVYDATRRVFLAARDMMRPGAALKELHAEVGALWEKEHIDLGLYSMADARKADSDSPLWKRYYPHGTSHSLGLDVHDPFERDAVLTKGMVLTCEPGIYIREEAMGIRLENDILIGSEGPEDLMENIPMEAEEIETLMQEGRR